MGDSRATTPSPSPGPSAGPSPSPSAGPSPGPSAGPHRATSTFVVGTFNLHAGVDGWGRPFDVVGACRAIDADVLVLEECWAPAHGPGIADRVAEAMGYSVLQHALAGGRLAGPDPRADARWMRSADWRGASHAIFLDSERPFGERTLASERYRSAQPGQWGVAVLSRLPMQEVAVVDLGRLARDRARRVALVATVRVGSVPVAVVGTHMSHLTYGAPRQYLRLGHQLRRLVGRGPAVLAGDMNLWGPPVALLLPGWARALRTKTWPAWRPHSHVDHVLVRGPLEVLETETMPPSGSDHLAVRVRLAVEPDGRAAGGTAFGTGGTPAHGGGTHPA